MDNNIRRPDNIKRDVLLPDNNMNKIIHNLRAQKYIEYDDEDDVIMKNAMMESIKTYDDKINDNLDDVIDNNLNNDIIRTDNEEEILLNKILLESIETSKKSFVNEEDEIYNKILLESIETAKMEEIVRKSDNLKNINTLQNKLNETEYNEYLIILKKYEKRKNFCSFDKNCNDMYQLLIDIFENKEYDIEKLNELIEKDYLYFVKNNKKSYITQEQYNILVKILNFK
jgi:hypothetical protein